MESEGEQGVGGLGRDGMSGGESGEARLAARGLAEHRAARCTQHDIRGVREDLRGGGG